MCGTAWQRKEIIVVPDVEKFPGHIACNSASRSEMVLPVIQNGSMSMVLDVDSDKLDDFDRQDQWFLEQVVEIVSKMENG